MCRSRRELSNAYLLAKVGFDTAENEPCEVCPSEVPISCAAGSGRARARLAHERGLLLELLRERRRLLRVLLLQGHLGGAALDAQPAARSCGLWRARSRLYRS